MISKLRKRVIIYTVVAVALVLVLLMSIINIANYIVRDYRAEEILYYLAENGGDFPMHMKHDHTDDDLPSGKEGGDKPFHSPKDMTEETPFETRFFSLSLKEDGTIKTINTGKIAAVSSSEAAEMANRALAKGKKIGYDGRYKYLIYDDNGEEMFIFLDCSRDMVAINSFLEISLLVSTIGLVAIAIVVVLLSPRMIKPIAESYAKQKEFITNAGHELKTPMTVIKSCTEVIEMQSGETKWTEGIKEQVKKLSDLTTHMVALAKMDEGGDLPMEDVNLSMLVKESLEGFSLEAELQNRVIESNIEDGINVSGNQTLLNELISILADNALKYGAKDKPIKFSLSRNGKKIVLSEENYAEGLSAGKHEEFFDRFYRGDTSHNSETPGSGIGLSMARSIVEAHGGNITAESPDGKRLIITAMI